MMELMYDFCLLYKKGNNKGFRVVDLQINDILILTDDIFAATKEKELKMAKLLTKNGEKLTLDISIKFNRGYIRLVADNSVFFSQEKKCQYLYLVVVKESINLVSFRNKIRKTVTLKDQYIAERARGDYIDTVS